MLDTDEFTLGQVFYMNSCAIPMGIVREIYPGFEFPTETFFRILSVK
jgi:hypothetical protein